MKALSLKYSNPVLSQIQGFAIFLPYWVKLFIMYCLSSNTKCCNLPCASHNMFIGGPCLIISKVNGPY